MHIPYILLGQRLKNAAVSFSDIGVIDLAIKMLMISFNQ